jgi:hypothetical protein
MPNAGAIFAPLDRTGEVRRALFGVAERTTPDGRLWCPLSVSDRLIRAVALRDFGLVALSQGAVRLARALVHLSGRDLTTILFGPPDTPGVLCMLSVDAFHSIVRSQPCISGAFDVSVTAITCQEPSLSTLVGGVRRPAVLPIARMPLQMAWLALVMEALGHAKVMELLGPLMLDEPSKPAHDVANALLRAFDHWLTTHLTTAYHMRQQRALRQALPALMQRHPEMIDDAAILDAWAILSARTDEQAFRLFATVAGKLVAMRSLARMLTLKSQHGGVSKLQQTEVDDDGDAIDEPLDWESPLVRLTEEPCDRVRWLTNTELTKLSPLVGTTHADDSRRAASPSVAATKPALNPFGPFDLALWRTLLRVMLFGSEQSRIVQAQRDGRPAVSRVHARAFSPVQDCYEGIRSWCADRRRLLDRESRIALGALIARDPDLPAIVAHRRAEIIESARIARREVARQGLKEPVTHELTEAYAAAAPALADLIGELDRLDKVLVRHDLAAAQAGDANIFSDIFQRLYRFEPTGRVSERSSS